MAACFGQFAGYGRRDGEETARQVSQLLEGYRIVVIWDITLEVSPFLPLRIFKASARDES